MMGTVLGRPDDGGCVRRAKSSERAQRGEIARDPKLGHTQCLGDVGREEHEQHHRDQQHARQADVSLQLDRLSMPLTSSFN